MNALPTRNCSTATVSLVFGILGWTVMPWIGSIIAVVTGHLARAEIRRDPMCLDGDGMAVAGLVLGWTMIILSLLTLLAILLFLGGLAAFIALLGAGR